MSWPAACASGPSWPQPVMRPNTRRGLRAITTSGPSPNRSITPGLKPSISASALARRSSTCAIAALSLRSSSTTFRPRPATDFRFFLAPTRSSVTTSAPMSASIMQANGPGPMPANSTMRVPASGPEVRALETWACEAEELIVSVTSGIHLLLFHGCFGIVPQRIAQGYLGSIGPQFGVLLLALGAGAFLGDLAAERDKDRNLLVTHRLHRLPARHRLFDIGRELFLLPLSPRDITLPKFRHDFFCEQFQRFANVLMLVAAALLDEHGLVDA